MRLLRAAVSLALAALGLLLGSGAALAQQAQGAQTFTLQPGGRATISFEAFCTNFGQKFPTAIQAPNALAPDNVRGALAYIQSQGYGSSDANALEAQYGLWRVVGATGSPEGGQVAAAVVNAASSAPAAPQGATSVVDAAKAVQVTVTVSGWQAAGQPVQLGSATDTFYGRGTLTVENTSGQALTLYHPVGALYPPATAGEQTMAAYATDVQVSNPAPANPAPGSTNSSGSTGSTGSSGQPQALPTTAEGDGTPSPAWLLAGLLIVAAGMLLRRRAA